MEKPQTLWHSLKLHPYDGDIEGKKARRELIISQNYEEVLFNEPVEQFYDLLTGGNGVPQQQQQQQQQRGKATKGAKQAAQQQLQAQNNNNNGGGGGGARTAEIPYSDSPKNPYSQRTEAKELDRLTEAIKTVDKLLKEEKAKMDTREKGLEELRKTEGIPPTMPKKK